jgi:hypothetical protein
MEMLGRGRWPGQGRAGLGRPERRAVTERTHNATELYAIEVERLNEFLKAAAIDQETHPRAAEEANGRLLRSSQAWTDCAARFLQDYVAESEDAATATERAFATAFGGAEDSLVGFATRGKFEFQSSTEFFHQKLIDAFNAERSVDVPNCRWKTPKMASIKPDWKDVLVSLFTKRSVLRSLSFVVGPFLIKVFL